MMKFFTETRFWRGKMTSGGLFVVLFLSPFSLLAQPTCAPAAEFSYNGSSFCQSGADPIVSHVTGTNGFYSYVVVSGGPTLALNPATGDVDVSASSPGTYNVTNSVGAPLVITGVVDGPLTGGIPKAVEFFAKTAIPNLSIFSFSSANNGAAPPAVPEFTFPAVAVPAFTRIWVATEATAFTNYFGFAPTYVNSNAPNINGDDAIVLYQNSTIIDVFGVVGQDGTGTLWDYEDGWAYRKNNTGADGSTFVLANWNFSGINALDNTATNAAAMNPWPINTYTSNPPPFCTQQITIVAPPVPAEAGTNQMVCENGSVILAASPAVGQWTTSNVGTFNNAGSATATYSPGTSGIHVLTWTVTSSGGACSSSSDHIFITVLESSDAEFSYPVTFFCGNDPNPTPQHATGKDGRYTFTVLHGGPNLAIDCNSGVINVANSNPGTYQVTNRVSGCGNMVISGVIDGPVTGGLPKAVEFFVLEDIPDLSEYGFGSANNGGGTDGQEFTFPCTSAVKGTYIWVATESPVFQNFFGFAPFATANLAASVNGDDAIELFCNGMVIDVFGDITYSNPAGLPWLYTDSWAYRKINTGPDGSFFQLGNWNFGGVDALDPHLTNAAATAAGVGVPAQTFTTTKTGVCGNASFNQVITIEEVAPTCPQGVQLTLDPGFCSAAVYYSATDNCPGNLTVTMLQGLPSGSFFPIGNNVVNFKVEDAAGNVATCTLQVNILEFPDPTPTLKCNELVVASLDDAQPPSQPGNLCTGQAFINADMLLEGGPYGCYDHYQIMITNSVGQNVASQTNPPSASLILDCNDLGKVYTFKVTDPETGNSCWGEIKVEDKLPPLFKTCTSGANTCQDRTVNCTQTVSGTTPARPATIDNCDNSIQVTLTELELIDADACDDNVVRYRRSFVAVDNFNNTSTCTEIITVNRPSIVNFPDNRTFQCTQYASFPGIVNPTSSGAGIPTGIEGEWCQYAYTSSDELLEMCNGAPGVFKIVRTWTVLDWCTGQIVTSGVGGEDNVQVIEVVDQTPPVIKICEIPTDTMFEVYTIGQAATINGFTVNGVDQFDFFPGAVLGNCANCNPNVVVTVIGTVSVPAPNIKVKVAVTPANPNCVQYASANVKADHPKACYSTDKLPVATVTDNCSGVKEVKVFTPVGEAVNGSIPFPGLEIGTYTITVQAIDWCGNVSNFNYTLEVVDDIVPVTICDAITEVDLTSDGYAEVSAEVFDDGSFDNCCLDHFEVRRMTDPCDDGHDDLQFGSSVWFCCADAAGTNEVVVFRAFDCFGNFNDCMVQVQVQDKVHPILVDCPGNERITCDWYAQNLEAQLAGLTTVKAKNQFLDPFFGVPQFSDNCNLTLAFNFSSPIDQCLEGRIIRTWSATDAGLQNAPGCVQTIFIDHVSDWVVEFPADVTINCGTEVPDFGEPKVFFETCELVAISFEDEFFNVVPDACYKILRTWTVINWCVVGAEIDQEIVESSELAFQQAYPAEPCDFNGVNGCNNRTFRDSWRAVPKNTPGASIAFQSANPDTDPDTDPWDGFITYQQVIKVQDTVDPVFASGCAIPDVCISDNTCATILNLPTPTVNECSSTVTFTATGDLGDGFGPFANVAPGTYSVTYTAMDNCNNQQVCHTTVKVKDCKAPTPYCKVGIGVTIQNTTIPPSVTVWASDLDDASFDNCPGELTFSFSTDTTEQSFEADCEQLGATLVNIYVTDAAGNQAFCQSFVNVQDNQLFCPQPFISMGGSIANEENESIEGVEVSLSGSNSSMVMTGADGSYQFSTVEPGGDYSLIPQKDVNPLNGVTTFDLVLISKHILGVQALNSPYKIIAADANHSNSVTTFDLVQLRKLILFVDDDFPNNTSWRFVDKKFVFPNPANPFQSNFPELLNFNNVATSQLEANFIAVKIGDVNGSASPTLLGGNDDRSVSGNLVFETDEREFQKGETFEVQLAAPDFAVSGFQFTFDFDLQSLDLVEVVPGLAKVENFGLTLIEKGAVTASWNATTSHPAAMGEVFGLKFQAKTAGKLSEALRLNSRFTPAEAYAENGNLLGVQLHFNNQVAAGFKLYQNTPNPFSDFTVIGFYLPEAAAATLTLTDVSGKTIKVMSSDFAAGYNEVKIKGSELNSPGVFYYQLETEGFTATRKLVKI